MRITAEPLPNTSQLLVRLLGSDVVFGSYQLDATPQIREPVAFDVLNGMVRNDEVRLYFTGFASYPDYVVVTHPDGTTQRVSVVQVILDKDPLTIEQPVETLEKEEKPTFSMPQEIETVSPPELPRAWLELSFERTSPLEVGTYVASTPLSYIGGAKGRALTDTVAQLDQNIAPYLQGVSPRIEGTWTNFLPFSSFDEVVSRAGLFDPVPVGWNISLVNPDDLLRIAAYKANPIPSLQITWRGEESSRSVINVLPRAQITTPAVPSGKTLQFLASPDQANDRGGYLQLTTATGLYTSPSFSLEPGIPRIVRFSVQDDPGPVKITWFQRCSESTNQIISLVAASATDYESLHTWAPSSTTSEADIIEIASLVYENRRWPFHQGYIRVDSDVENILEPISWSIESALGPTILKVDEGQLSSSFSTTTLTLSDYLSTNLSEAGNYKIKWSSEGGFRLTHRDNPTGVSLPFAFTIPITHEVKEAPIRFRIRSFRSNVGSGVMRYFGFMPK